MGSDAAFGEGLVAFVKRACPTCVMIEPVLREVAGRVSGFRVVSQDDPGFPAGGAQVVDDRELERSWRAAIEVTPTLVRYADGGEVERVAGWDRAGWRRLTGLAALGGDLPPLRPG